MGNTDKFEMIANVYDTPERSHIAKVSSDQEIRSKTIYSADKIFMGQDASMFVLDSKK